MHWEKLTDITQLDEIDRNSAANKVMIFKHSRHCSISKTVLSRIEKKWSDEFDEKLTAYYLDLLTYRSLSSAIAERYGVMHQSPQILIISNGKCIYSQTHSAISVEDIMEAVN